MITKQWATFFLVVGSFILFASWVVENYLQKKWEEEKQDSDWKRNNANEAEILFQNATNQWRNTLFVYSKNMADSSAINNFYAAVSDYGYAMTDNELALASLANVHESKYNSKWFDSSITHYSAVRDTFKQLMEIGLDTAHSYVCKLYNSYGKNSSEIVDDINTYRDLLAKKANAANKAFLFFYILGSIFLGIAFIIDRQLEH